MNDHEARLLRLAGAKTKCPGNPGKPGRPCIGFDEDGGYEHTLCGGTGEVFLLPAPVREKCLCPEHIEGGVSFLCECRENCPGWNPSRDSTVWAKALGHMADAFQGKLWEYIRALAYDGDFPAALKAAEEGLVATGLLTAKQT